MANRPDRRDALDAYAAALCEAVDASGMSLAEIARRAVARGAGTLSSDTLRGHMAGRYKPADPETVWALEEVLGCEGQLSIILGFRPASERDSVRQARQARLAAAAALRTRRESR